ncbi:hypothetical protein KL918_001676 [Ogataea parapolymorpha]|uniref:Mediator of RNA polymerase II transcription subunit 20 n=1 Tax=Ogataea parapolymorpha (strain ATCC 26012 / BCRC 20466 / JCM 22074 / NRRL Y-7560 / DL-1) TaxID=871575 RepID=W1QD44_OGAPD|nr:Subunit of the RNA polymerase II mediator complex [Ogataea parapolymorpha DL-1]ESW99393.1 Subunit of the RNA polymerase II mediator complex [Ogataea parapolymorpha DL-1]KAG7869033.1 hypothetical protein KL918_001676 [Ogataea parapolymorpha]KAG7874114.1 hypothetical protein KL916_001888 [Ogataea parapolymorpha]KAG7885506.1 hypothetical protein KL938_000538 [Ogataea parapolymorpha]
MQNSVLFVQNATPTTITTFHDLLSNELPQSLGPWNFELKIFLNNKFSRPANFEPNQIANRYLYTLQLSYYSNQTISIINNSKSIITKIPNTGTLFNDSSSPENSALIEHIKHGCANNMGTTMENFERLITKKLASLWTVKQTIKGEGGYGYIISVPGLNENGQNEKFRLRTSNCFLHGLFKGFLIEIEHLDDEIQQDDNLERNGLIVKFTNSINKIKSLIDLYKFPEGNLCFNVLNETKLDYLSDLCQQYCDALQF